MHLILSANAPGTQRGTRGPLTHLCEVTIVDFLGIHITYVASCSQIRSFEVLEVPTVPAGAPWGMLGPQNNSKRDFFGGYGPLGPRMVWPPWPDAPITKSPSYVYGRGMGNGCQRGQKEVSVLKHDIFVCFGMGECQEWGMDAKKDTKRDRF